MRVAGRSPLSVRVQMEQGSDSTIRDPKFRTDNFMMYGFKIAQCSRQGTPPCSCRALLSNLQPWHSCRCTCTTEWTAGHTPLLLVVRHCQWGLHSMYIATPAHSMGRPQRFLEGGHSAV